MLVDAVFGRDLFFGSLRHGDVRCRILEAGDFNRLAEQAPQLKIALLENLNRDLAEKLRRTTQWVSALA